MYNRTDLKAAQASAVKGAFEPIDALRRMLAGTKFRAAQTGSATFVVTEKGTGTVVGMLNAPAGSQKTVAGVDVVVIEGGMSTSVDRDGKFSLDGLPAGVYTLMASGDGFSRLRITDVVVHSGHVTVLAPEVMPVLVKDGDVLTIGEVVVSGSKDVETLDRYLVQGDKQSAFTDLNLDIPRTIDDIQPYYMWDASKIAATGSVDVQGFFQRMVPMNTNRLSEEQNSQNAFNFSNISLGGLGSNTGFTSGTQNTLILLDGVPLPSIQYVGNTYQPNLNGIPLAAIDHVEVLPASASAIYGGSAAGGAVNIVLKHDFNGVELKMTYGNTFNTDAPTRNVSLTVGQSLEGGKTNILFTASYQNSKPLLLQDRLSQIITPNENRLFSGTTGGELGFLGIGGASPSAFSTLPTVASSKGIPLFVGSTATTVQVPAGYLGSTSSGLAPLQANVGNYDLSHPNNATIYGIGGLQMPLTSSPTEKAVELIASRKITGWLEVYAEFGNSTDNSTRFEDIFSFKAISVPATAPGNPFGQTVVVSGLEAPGFQPFETQIVSRSLSAGAKFTLPKDWKGDLDYTWGATEMRVTEGLTDTTALQAAATAGTVNLIADLRASPFNASLFRESSYIDGPGSVDALQLKAAGPLMKLWAGSPALAVGLAHEKEGGSGTLEALTFGAANPTASEVVYFPGASESDNSAYGELTFPLLSKANRIFGVSQLDFQAAGRFDGIEEFTTSPSNSTTNHLANGTVTTSPNLLTGAPEPFTPGSTNYHAKNGTIGLKYRPIDDFFFRASYSTAFVPPTFSQLRPPISTGTVTQTTGSFAGVPSTSPWPYQSITDPQLNATYTVPVITGGNPLLTPETSHGVDWGFVIEPTFAKGLRISVDYTKVTKYNDIVTPSAAILVANPSSFPGRVVRGTAAAGQSVGPIVLIDATSINAPMTNTASYNIDVDYTLDSGTFGVWKFSAIGSSWQHFQIQSTIGGATVEQLSNPYTTVAGVGAGLARFKGNLGLDWSKGSLSAGWLARYVGPYTDGAEYGIGGVNPIQGTVNGFVSGQIYHDLYVGYHFSNPAKGGRWWDYALSNLTLQVGVKNLFNKVPPYDGVNGLVFEYTSEYGDVQMANYYLNVTKRW